VIGSDQRYEIRTKLIASDPADSAVDNRKVAQQTYA